MQQHKQKQFNKTKQYKNKKDERRTPNTINSI